MCEKLLKIEALKREISVCCGTCADKPKLANLAEDIHQLEKSDDSAVRAWELAMMALIGTDGIGSSRRIVGKVLDTLESISYMSPEMAAAMAPQKARQIIELIEEEKRLARG